MELLNQSVVPTKSKVFIHIIGSPPNKPNSKSKISGYSQTSMSMIFQKLSEFFPTCQKTHVFAYGKKSDYQIYQNTNNKCYFQLDYNRLYELDVDEDPKFTYFNDFKEMLREIEEVIHYSDHSDVTFLIDDHGNKCLFTPFLYLLLYQIMMRNLKCNFLVLNDSCFSGIFADVVKTYNKIYAFKLQNKFQNTYDFVCSMKKLTKIILKEAKIVNDLKIYETIINIVEFFSNTKIHNKEELTAITLLGSEHSEDNDAQKNQKLSSIKIPDGLSVEALNKLGFETVQDVLNFKYVISSLYTKEMGPLNIDDLYSRCKRVFTIEGYDIFKAISYVTDNNLDIVDESNDDYFREYKRFNFAHVPHPNIEIISFEKPDLNYPNVGFNEWTKVSPGSVGMNALIKEVFMKLDGQPINYDNIRREIIEFSGIPPQHFKIGDYQFVFKPTECFLDLIYNLRSLTFSTAENLRKVAKHIAPDFSPKEITNTHDEMGCIVAITAVARDAIINEGLEIYHIEHSFDYSNFIKHPIQLQPESISTIVLASLKLSKDPVKMSALTYHCLQEAVQQIAKEKNYGSEFVKAAVSVIPKSAITFALIIASLQMKEGNAKNAFYHVESPSYVLEKLIYIFYEEATKAIRKMDNDEEIMVYAQKCLLAYAKYSLNYLDDMCDLQIIIEMADMIYKYSIDNYSALAVFIAIAHRSSFTEMKITEIILLDAIQQVFASLKTQFYFEPVVLSRMKPMSALAALAIALYDIEQMNGPILDEKAVSIKICNQIQQILQRKFYDIYNKEYFSKLVDEFLKDGIVFSKERIEKLRSNLLEEATNVIKELDEYFTKCINNYILNTGNRISMQNLEESKKSYTELKKTFEASFYEIRESLIFTKIKDLRGYLHSKKRYFHSIKLHSHGFEADLSSFNFEMAYQKAANELYSAAALINVSEHSKEIDFKQENITQTSIEVMMARTCNIVEMEAFAHLPNIKIHHHSSDVFPITTDEIIAFGLSGVKHYHSPKDNARDHFEEVDVRIKKKKQSRLFSPSDIQSLNRLSKVRLFARRKGLWESTEEIVSILFGRHEAGKSDWYNDARIAFVHCFNRQVKDLGINFDPKIHYNQQKASLLCESSEVHHIYPTNRIEKFDALFSNFCSFAGKHEKHIAKIKEAFVMAFYEADREIYHMHLCQQTTQEADLIVVNKGDSQSHHQCAQEAQEDL